MPQTVAPEVLAEAVDYARAHRDPALPPLDVAIEGATPAYAPLREYADAGLTWWVETIGWFRGTPEEMRRVVAAGPPAACLTADCALVTLLDMALCSVKQAGRARRRATDGQHDRRHRACPGVQPPSGGTASATCG